MKKWKLKKFKNKNEKRKEKNCWKNRHEKSKAETVCSRNGKGCVRKMLVNFGATLSNSGKCALSFAVVRVSTGHISRRETLEKCYFIIQIVSNKDMV